MTVPHEDPCPHGPDAITCQQCVDFLLEYVDDRLPTEQRARFDAHVAACAACERFLGNYRDAAALAREAGRELDRVEPAALPPELVEAILRARRGGDGGNRGGSGG